MRTPRLVTLVRHLLVEACDTEGWKIPDDDRAIDTAFDDVSCATKFGEMLEGNQSDLIVEGLQTLRFDEAQFRKLEDVCCSRFQGTASPNLSVHTVEKRAAILDHLAEEAKGVPFETLNRDGRMEIEDLFDTKYICLSDALEEVLASAQ